MVQESLLAIKTNLNRWIVLNPYLQFTKCIYVLMLSVLVLMCLIAKLSCQKYPLFGGFVIIVPKIFFVR